MSDTSHPRYRCELRTRDQALRVTNLRTGRPAAVRSAWWGSPRVVRGLFIEFECETGIFVFEEEIERVDEFPASC